MAKRGRKPKLTKELIKKATDIIRMGNYTETACEYLGIHKSTWYKWLSAGEKANSGLKREFFDAIKKAEAEAQIRNLGIIQQAAKENWQAAAWYLERKFPDQWGKKKYEVEHKGEMKTNNEHTITQRIVNDPVSRELARQLYRRSVGEGMGGGREE